MNEFFKIKILKPPKIFLRMFLEKIFTKLILNILLDETPT